jgi:hypothetical protein
VINKLKDAARDPALLKIVGNTPTKFSFLPSTAVGIVWDANAGVITAVEPTDATAGHDHVSKSIFLNLDQTLPYYNAY